MAAYCGGCPTAIIDIGAFTAGGFANAAAHDLFCAGTSCTITIIYGQSGRGNNLIVEAQNHAASASTLPLTVSGYKVYGLYMMPGVVYRDDFISNVAMNGAPEDICMLISGTHYNNQCCFNYGNAETANTYAGNGHMDAVNFGTEYEFPSCSEASPWAMAELENGLYSAGNGNNQNNLGNSSAFVTALLKNNGQNSYAIKGGNA